MKDQGFTLLELIIVIVLIGIIAINVVPRSQTITLSLELQARRLLDDIRYVQGLSMMTGQRYRWTLLNTTTYIVTNEAGIPILLPSGSTQITLSNRVVVQSMNNLPNNLIAFDSQGIPYTTSSYPGTALSAVATISLAANGSIRSVQIYPQTGYGVMS